MADQMREEFEAWERRELGMHAILARVHADYFNIGTQGRWKAWQAAWRTGRNALVNELDEADKEDCAALKGDKPCSR